TLEDDGSPKSLPARHRRGAALIVLLEGDRPLAKSSRHSLAEVSQVILGRGSQRVASRPSGPHAGQMDLRIPDPRMSSTHAVLARVRDKWFIEDSASRNGTRVSGERITQQELQDGDLIEVGRTVLVFRRDFVADGPPDLDAS